MGPEHCKRPRKVPELFSSTCVNPVKWLSMCVGKNICANVTARLVLGLYSPEFCSHSHFQCHLLTYLCHVLLMPDNVGRQAARDRLGTDTGHHRGASGS